MISQNRNEIYIIIGEYGPQYQAYIRNAPWKAGMPGANAPPLTHTHTEPAHCFRETLGSPTFLRQVVAGGLQKHIEGWHVREVSDALTQPSRDLSPSPGGLGPSPNPPASHGTAPSHDGGGVGKTSKTPPGVGSGTATSSISSTLPVRPAPKKDQAPSSGHTSAPSSGHATGSGRVTRSAAAAAAAVHRPDLPSANGFLIMHRFGPWRTDDPANMEVFIRRLLALMLELHANSPPPPRPSSSASSGGQSHGSSPHSSRGSSRAPNDRASSRAPSDRASSRAPSDRASSRAPSDRASSRAPSDRASSRVPTDRTSTK
jgi:hypothetical protein